jgi:hypothetical protein
LDRYKIDNVEIIPLVFPDWANSAAQVNTYPLGRARLTCFEKHFGRRLRKHGLGILAVTFFKLAAPLKSQDNRVAVFAIFGIHWRRS